MQKIKVDDQVIYKNTSPEYDRPMTVTKIEKNIYVHCLDGDFSKIIHVDNLQKYEDVDGLKTPEILSER